MAGTSYKAGDIIALKSRNHGDLASREIARIVAVLPEAQGNIRFRVRLEGENFDRTVSRDEIDALASPGMMPDRGAHESRKSGGWINHDLVRTRK